MLHLKTLIMSGLVALAASTLVSCQSPPSAEATQTDYTAMSAEALAEYLIFDAKGFRLDQKTQEGGTVRNRLTQDKVQKTCSALRGNPIDGATITEVRRMALESLSHPTEGIVLGDWKRGEQVARSGYGYRVGHKSDKHSKKPPGGNCYACHQMDPKEVSYGNVGPSLAAYGKIRGTGEAMMRYTYDVIYNPHTLFPCSNMPRFGTNGVLTKEQIADVMAYLMHADSPVNQ